jgi:hypothetical protein
MWIFMGRVSGTIVVEYEVLVMSCTVKLCSDQYQEVVMAMLCNEDKVVLYMLLFFVRAIVRKKRHLEWNCKVSERWRIIE